MPINWLRILKSNLPNKVVQDTVAFTKDANGYGGTYVSQEDGTMLPMDFGLPQQISILSNRNKKAVLYSDSFGRLISDAYTMYTEDNVWFNVLCDEMKWLGTNRAVSSAKLKDGALQMHNTHRGDNVYDYIFLNLGFNNMRTNGSTTGIDDYVANFLRYLAVYSISNKKDMSGFTKVGTWNSSILDLGYTELNGKMYTSFTQETSAYVTYQFAGDSFAVGTFAITNTSQNPNIVIEVDDVVVKTIAPSIVQDLTVGFNPYVVVVDGLQDIQHTVKIYNTKVGGVFHVNWIGALDKKANVFINQITKMTSAGYASYSGTGSDAVVNAINSKIVSMLSDLNLPNIKSIEMSQFNPINYIGTDTIHPNLTGSIKLKNIVKNAITP